MAFEGGNDRDGWTTARRSGAKPGSPLFPAKGAARGGRRRRRRGDGSRHGASRHRDLRSRADRLRRDLRQSPDRPRQLREVRHRLRERSGPGGLHRRRMRPDRLRRRAAFLRQRLHRPEVRSRELRRLRHRLRQRHLHRLRLRPGDQLRRRAARLRRRLRRRLLRQRQLRRLRQRLHRRVDLFRGRLRLSERRLRRDHADPGADDHADHADPSFDRHRPRTGLSVLRRRPSRVGGRRRGLRRGGDPKPEGARRFRQRDRSPLSRWAWSLCLARRR